MTIRKVLKSEIDDIRKVYLRAQQYMKDTGIADTMLILPEFEFHLFDNAGWNISPDHISMHVDASQAYWNSETDGKDGCLGCIKIRRLVQSGSKRLCV